MDKESIIAALREKAGVDNYSDRTYSEVAEAMLPKFSDDSKITDESWEFPISLLKVVSGQMRHDIADGIKNGKSVWEKEVSERIEKEKEEIKKTLQKPAEETKAVIPDDNANIDQKIAGAIAAAIEGLTSESGAIGKMSKQFSDFMTQVAAEKQAQTEEMVRGQVRDYLIGRGADEEDFALTYTLEKMAIGEKPDIAALQAKAEKDYEANYKLIHRNSNVQPFAGGAGGVGNGQDSRAEFDKFIQQKKAELQKQEQDADELKKLMM